MLIELDTHSGKKQQIFAFADTHGKHRKITVPDSVETVIFAGDACNAGDHVQLMDFFAWFSTLPVKNKLFVPGNHDLPFEFAPNLAKNMVSENVIFLENEGVTIEGVHYYSLPARPWMHEVLYLPSDVDILVTHGAPKGILDADTGCPILRKLIALEKPKNHIFGHIHQTAGQSVQEGSTMFWNVAVK
jgi:Icc-related predicted phosphoesterase